MPTSLEAMDRLIHVLATHGPGCSGSRWSWTVRQSDVDAMDAWRDRMMSRLGGMGWVIEWIARDGLLAPGWTVDQAAEWWWALSSPQVQELLTVVRDWTAEQYEVAMRQSVRAALTTAAPPPAARTRRGVARKM